MGRLILKGAALTVLVVSMAFAGALIALVEQGLRADGRPDRAHQADQQTAEALAR